MNKDHGKAKTEGDDGGDAEGGGKYGFLVGERLKAWQDSRQDK